jgi:protein phosphatase methylesterase 1
VYLTKPPSQPGPCLLLLHGGGFSALSWSLFTVEITQQIHCQCLAIDIRGHGDSKVDEELDLSAETLAADVESVVESLYGENPPSIILLGHSMGGAIGVHIGFRNRLPSLVGLVVIDVVEGTALEALTSMQSFLRSRPSHFKSISHAIEWSVRSGQIRNAESAKVSMPGQIINCSTGKLATNELPLNVSTVAGAAPEPVAHAMAIVEESEEGDTPPASTTFKPPTALEATKNYTWRIDLSKSEKYWTGWFQGLSQKFLDLRVPKLLLLAGIDNLDKTLQIGQMQGKFQMQVLPKVGHAVHEDSPHQVAEVVGSFIVRNRFAAPLDDFHRVMPEC